MADDNIVRPQFGRKKPETVEATSLPRRQDSLSSFVRATAGDDSWAGKFKIETPDGKKTEQNVDMTGFSTILGTFDLQKVLGKLVQRHEGKIQEYKSLVESYSNEDLQGWLANPKDSDLQRKPYFFHALIDEAKRRFLRPEVRPAKQDAGEPPGGYKNPNPGDVSEDYKDIGPLEGEALVRAQKDLMYMLANQDFVHTMRNKLEAAGDVIHNLAGYTPDQESIRLRREALKSYSLRDICDEVDKTHELQWRKQPSYVGALTLEHHYRVQAALSLMSKEEQTPE